MTQDKNEGDPPVQNAKWTEEDTVIYLYGSSLAGSELIASFDMDSTLVEPKSGKKFPVGKTDWRWWRPEVPTKLKALHADGYKIVIFTNQAGIEKNKTKKGDIMGKISMLSEELSIPLQAYISAATDSYRKPNTRMWDLMVEKHNGGVKVDMEKSFYCGDAAGRPKSATAKKDFSCGDRSFAFNIGIPFKTPEELFLGEKADPIFDWGSIDPVAQLLKYEQLADSLIAKYEKLALQGTQELIICVGTPASGKSTFTRRYFVPKGYIQINQDTVGTKDKCVKMAQQHIADGKSVVIDNTNPSEAVRAEYLAIAKSHSVQARCLHFQTDVELAHHLNFYREKLQGVRRIPDVGYNMFKSKFESPNKAEGFTEIVEVEWAPKFEDDNEKRLFLQRTG
eukprot:TRINITY_DN206_c0_g1_i1.p1 TRINITY_DN206_c0_g1~~TRINITY_DN206_c0_g1_i1.p1  ORF type:complete len:433 (-),score=177.45 TRINITY_DN206_c0_g1_i1:147-1328(-)